MIDSVLPPHPDELLNKAQAKALRKGGRMSADTAAMNAMFDALDAGASKEEANKIFSQTYLNIIHGNINLSGTH